MKLNSKRNLYLIFTLLISAYSVANANARCDTTAFKVIAFYTAKHDAAHISFVHEANRWFSKITKEYNFNYDSTNDWSNLNSTFLSNYKVVLFLDTRPEDSTQRAAFETYMKNGGAWMGFHFAGFALTPSDYPQNWNWYYNDFIAAGQYIKAIPGTQHLLYYVLKILITL